MNGTCMGHGTFTGLPLIRYNQDLCYESFSRKIYLLVRPDLEHCPYCLSTDRRLSFRWRFLIWAEYKPAKETIPPQSAGKSLSLSLCHSFQFNKQFFGSPVKLKYNVYLSVVNNKISNFQFSIRQNTESAYPNL